MPELPAPGDEEKAAPTVARALFSKLDCAVLAMRYAVEAESPQRWPQGL